MKRSLVLTLTLIAVMLPALTLAGQARSAGVDTTPPTGRIVLPAAVTMSGASLVLRVTDPESGVTDLRVSDDGVTYGDWQALPATGESGYPELAWVPPAEGPRTVYVEVRNGVGLTKVFSATTTADGTAPVLMSAVPADGSTPAVPPLEIVLSYDEPLARSPLPVASLVTGPAVTAHVVGAEVHVTPSASFTPHTTYQLTVDGVHDVAGNPTPAVVVTFTVDRLASTLRLTSTASVVRYGTRIALRGTLNLPGAPLVLSAVPSGGDGSETAFAWPTADALGAYGVRVTPSVTTLYRATYAGDADHLPVQRSLTVRVRPRLTLKTPADFWLGKRVALSGRVAPAHPGSTVTIQRRKGAGSWKDWRTETLDDASSFHFSWKPGSYGIYKFRLQMAADDAHVFATTDAQRVVVNNPNPHHISIVYPKFIVIDIGECQLYYYESGRVVKVFKCVLGKPSTPTPTGQWAVYTKSVAPGGPFGAYAMFYYRGYGIHGTNEEYLLSYSPRYFSHGCCRLYNWAITWLWPKCPIGTPVRNVY